MVGVECGENRGRTGGEPGENRRLLKEPGENRGHLSVKVRRGRREGDGTENVMTEHPTVPFWRPLLTFTKFGKRTGGEPGAFGIHLQRVLGEKRGLWPNGTRTGGEPGGGNFLWNKRPNSGPENQRTGPPMKISIGKGYDCNTCCDHT